MSERLDRLLASALDNLGRLGDKAPKPQAVEARVADPAPLFGGFQTCGDPALEGMRDAAVRFCSDMARGEAARWLTLLGPSSVGKTLTARIVRKYHASHIEFTRDSRGFPVVRRSIFLEWGRALSWMVEGDYSFLRDVADCHLLILDDVGAEYSRLRDLSTSKLYEVLCGRRYKSTVITANLSAQQIAERLDTRICSRLFRDGSEVIEIPPGMPDFNMRTK